MTLPARIARRRRAYVPLFWRLLVPNACVLVVACIALWIEPANGRIVALGGGLAVMLVLNVVLMRRAFGPLVRLTSAMYSIDPLRPGQRIPAVGPESEVTVLTDAFNDMLDRVETERRESALRALRAQEDERRRLTAELHDQLGQTLTALSLELQHVSRAVSTNGADPLGPAKAATADPIEDVRRMARTLRPEVLDELGLPAALTTLCDRLSRPGELAIVRRFDAQLPPLDPAAELVVYRVVQESLTNVLRHAGARTVDVALRRDGDALDVRVRDDGRGVPARTGRRDGNGIRGMRERAVAIGASLAVARCVGGGTEVVLRVPLEPPAT